MWEYGYLGLLVILAIIIQFVLHPEVPTGPDVEAYTSLANEQMQTGFWWDPSAFRDNFWSMAYPTILASLLRFSGNDLGVVVHAQTILAASLIVVPWLLTRHISGKVRFVAPFVLLINPALWWMGWTIGYEFLLSVLLSFALAIAWAVRFSPRHSERWSLFWSAVVGLLLAGAILTQTKSLIVVPVIVYVLYSRSRRSAWIGSLATVAGRFPWMLRNWIITGNPSPLSRNAEYNFWVGNNPLNPTGGSMLIAPTTPSDKSQVSAAVDFIVSQPERFIELLWSKAARLAEPVFVYPAVFEPGPLRTALHLLSAVMVAFLACQWPV